MNELQYLKALGELFQPVRKIAEVAELAAAGPPLTGTVGTGRCEISYVWSQCWRDASCRVTAGCVGERLGNIAMCDVCLEIMRGGGVLCVRCGLAHPLVCERVELFTDVPEGTDG